MSSSSRARIPMATARTLGPLLVLPIRHVFFSRSRDFYFHQHQLPPTPTVHDPSSPLDLEHGKRRSCKAFLMDQWLKLIWSCKRVDELAQTHPSFLTLKSVDLFPNKLDGCFLPLLISIVHKCYTEFSSLNRYPIYIVPSRNNEKELEACFLTYHTLPSSFEGVAYTSCFIPCLRMLLSTFYKL
ncbi:hypothetical protein V8G54_012009 [Vigna mungo]|uniref:Uncharacterized protein n=1 Tax=Vigna mungo TaxID=3915 RepID=A0AAQ3NS57_VIGMU